MQFFGFAPRRAFGIALSAFLLCLAFSYSASAQSTITGIVYDKQRNPLVDVDIELLNDLYQSLRRTKSDGSGRYNFDGLSNGRWYIRVYAFRYDLEDQQQEVLVDTQNIRGGQGSGFFIADFYLMPRKGGLAESELGVVFAQDVPAEAKKLYQKGVDEFSKQKPDEGIKSLNEAIQIFPNYFLALFRIGKELHFQQRYEESARFLYKAVEVNPKNASAFYYLGSSFFKMGKDYNKAALASLNQAHILAPGSMQVLWALGRVERAEKMFVEAEKHLLQAKKVSGGGVPEIHQELVSLYSNDLKKYKEAADELELFIKASKLNDEEKAKFKAILEGLREKAKKQTTN
jgi:tetratricopeptide (TPR) repeat protein